MKVAGIFSHRNGRDLLESPSFAPAFHEFLEVLDGLPPFRSDKEKKTSAKHVISPSAMNRWLDYQLGVKLDWELHPLIIDSDPASPESASRLRSDFRKARIEVEVQFGNVARYAYDVYKMAISMALDHSDVGLMVVCTKKFADITGGNIAYFERAVRELERSRLTLIVPLTVIGIEPEQWIIDSYPTETEAPTIEEINKGLSDKGESAVSPTESADLPPDQLARLYSYILAG